MQTAFACGPSDAGAGLSRTERAAGKMAAATWFHASIKTMGRSTGRSACAAAAYRAGRVIHDERTGLTHDYTRKTGIEFSAVMLPANAPAELSDPARLWNAAEAAEKRKNSMTARELELALPSEVTPAMRRELAEAVGRFLVERYGVAAHVSIHRPHREGDQRNHHAHILFTTRRLGPEGFGEKTRELDDRKDRGPKEVEAIREAAATFINRALERAGVAERVDHRSFDRQGVDKEAAQHLGPAAGSMERRGESTDIGDRNRAAAERNAEREELREQAKIIDLAIERERRREQQQDGGRVPAHVQRREQARFETWANAIRAERQSRQLDQQGELGRALGLQSDKLESELAGFYGPGRNAAAELKAIMARQERGGFWYRLTRAKADRERAAALARNLADIRKREAEQRGKLEREQQEYRQALAQRHERERLADEQRIDRARDRREAEGWKPREPRQPQQEPQPPPPEEQREEGRATGTGGGQSAWERIRQGREELRRQRGDDRGRDREPDI